MKKPTPKLKSVSKRVDSHDEATPQKQRVVRRPIQITKNAIEGKLQKPTNQKTSVPLVVEPYPREYTGLPFLTLIQFRKQPMLVIVDNVDAHTIRAYVLDLCGPERVDEEQVISVAADWFKHNRSNFPLSIEFSRRGITNETARIYRAFDVEFVSRVIGPVPEFPMDAVKSVKRRRRKMIQLSIEVVRKEATTSLPIDQFFG